MKKPIAFPSEVIFPGLKNPTREAHEAEMFLAHGAKPFAGFDPHDPATRRDLIDRPGQHVKTFTPFQVAPPPPLAARLAALPEGWEDHEDTHAGVLALGIEIEQWADLPPFLCVIIEGRTAHVTRR